MNDLFNRPEYKPVKEMVEKDEILYLTLSGSHAYGTNNSMSDIDLRGVMKTPVDTLLGLETFEQFEDKETDTVIYTTNKFLKLLLGCNPNCVELMGTKEDHQLHVSDIGQLILDNYQMFLSQRVFYTFEGYAMAQLNRLKNALTRNSESLSIKNQRIAERLSNMLYDFNARYEVMSEGSMTIHGDSELHIDIDLKKYPLRDMLGIFSEMQNTVKDFDKLKPGIEGLNKRNKKKSPEKLDKHAMHLVRLYMMSIELGKTGQVVTYREKEHDLLMSIRNGAFRKSDGTYKDDFFDIVEKYKSDLEIIKKETVLPVAPDMDKVKDFIVEVNRRTLR